MEQGVIIFYCPACATRLQLPVSLAGVSGPCPRCETLIQSPSIPTPASPSAYAPAPGPSSTTPGAATGPAAQRQAAAASRIAASPAAVPIAPRMPSNPTKPRPSPRSAPATSAPAGPPVNVQPRTKARPSPIPRERLVKPSKSAAAPVRSQQAQELQYRPHQARRSRMLSWGIPVAFIIACLSLFTGVLLVLRPKPTIEETTNKVPSNGDKSSDAGLRPIQIEPRLPHKPGRQPEARPSPTGTIARPSGDPHPLDLAARATNVVQDFLEATSLEERLPLIITRRSPEEIAGTSLAGILPNHQVPELERQITLPRELLTEFFYTATFPDATAPNPRVISILVRQRGSDDPPKVLADPFIDLFDGGIREFSAKPLDGSRTFHVLAEPIPICSDLAVPEPDQRITMRLRPHEHGEELASAYTRKLSKIGEMLNEPRSALRWGQAHPCIVTVQWNREVPEQPFLELVRLDALTWNH